MSRQISPHCRFVVDKNFYRQFGKSSCRRCENDTQWRCDDGGRIDETKWDNGIVDCLDGSDEGTFISNIMLIPILDFLLLF